MASTGYSVPANATRVETHVMVTEPQKANEITENVEKVNIEAEKVEKVAQEIEEAKIQERDDPQQCSRSVQQDGVDSRRPSSTGVVSSEPIAIGEPPQSPIDYDDPRAWNAKRKWSALTIVSLFNFVTSISSSMVAPALPAISQELSITDGTDQYLLVSIFVLAYSFGPLLWGPLSEMYGRVVVLRVSNLIYLAFNTGCGFAQSNSQMTAFRFLSGFGGSAPLVLASGVIGDVFTPDERGKAISVYTIAPLLGPAVGPIVGGLIAEHTTWRWIFWSTSILAALVQGVGTILLRETYAPVLLRAKNKAEQEKQDVTVTSSSTVTPRSLIWANLSRAVFMLATQPIIQSVGLYLAYIYGLVYLVLSTLPTVWNDVYQEQVDIGSLHYLAIGLGFFLGTQVCAPLQDSIYRRLKHGNNGVAEPEFRIPLMIPAALFLSAGLFIYGWTAYYKVHWIGVDIGTVTFSIGSIIGLQCIQSYIIDAYPLHAASAVSAATFLRSLAGFGLPLLATPLYNSLGLGWGNSLLGFLAFGFGAPMPFLLWRYGKKIRGYAWFTSSSSQ
ncbi:major facilitator superfamily domain-containing protein [Trichoderma compactum]